MRRRYYDDENLPKEGEGNQQFTGVIPGRSEDQRKRSHGSDNRESRKKMPDRMT